MKYRTYFITLFAYMTVHFLRVSVPFIQLDLQNFYSIDNFFMGIVSASMYITVGIGYFYLLAFPIKNTLARYLISMGITGLAYLVIYVSIQINFSSKYLFIGCMTIAGFAQVVAYPVCIKLIFQHFNPKKDGLVLGIWSAHGDMGNIIGFFIYTVIVYKFHWSWTICLLFASGATFTMAIVMKLFLVDTNEASEKYRDYTWSEIQQQLKKYLENGENIALLMNVCLLKALLYGIILWLPMYFQEASFEEFQGYIPITFSLFTIVGSAIFGSFYTCIRKSLIRSIIVFVILMAMIGGLLFLKTLDLVVEQKWSYLGIIGEIGFCLGGLFNMLISLESRQIAKKAKIDVYFIVTLMMACSNIIVGIVQLFIGIAINEDTNSIFLIFIIFGGVSLFVEIIRGIILFSKRETDISVVTMDPLIEEQIQQKF